MLTIYTTEVFDRWFAALKDKQAARRIQVRIDRAEDGYFGDHKSVGQGVLGDALAPWAWISGVFHVARRRNGNSFGGRRQIESGQRH